MTKAIMIQGAGSNVGKSMLVAGLCRAFKRRGLSVAPFKPQNMSNNAAVTPDGGEIGRAQALQALACGLPPHVDMNPVLLKPESETGAQVIVQGKRIDTQEAHAYGKKKETLIGPVLESFHRLARAHDLIIVEGAGSPAEVNLRRGDIANMGFAEAAGVPVILFGDIDRGGVIAQLVGTYVVLPPEDRAHIRGFGINKFRGDTSLFADGMTAITDHTGWPAVGILPWFMDAWRLPAEDVLDLHGRPGGHIKIAVPKLSRIANFDDLDPLSAEPDVAVEIIEHGQPLPADADLVLIPGTKSTVADTAYFRAQGWDIDLKAHIRRGGRVLGICGGYQMLGRMIHDDLGLEGPPSAVEGLGHLNTTTHMQPQKRVKITNAQHIASGCAVSGYEIHLGDTTGPDTARPWLTIDGSPEGATSSDGRIMGCYIHGLFASDAFRAAFLKDLGGSSKTAYGDTVENALDALANHIETHLDVDLIASLAGTVDYS